MTPLDILRRIPAALSLLIMGAHFLRAGNPLLMLVSLVFLVLVFIPHSRVQRFVQIGLILGALEWLRTLVFLVLDRQAQGRPFQRLAWILIGVSMLTGLSALLLRPRFLRKSR